MTPIWSAVFVTPHLAAILLFSIISINHIGMCDIPKGRILSALQNWCSILIKINAVQVLKITTNPKRWTSEAAILLFYPLY